MDNNTTTNLRSLHYKKLAKEQKKRWRKRRLLEQKQRRTHEVEKKRAERVAEMEVEAGPSTVDNHQTTQVLPKEIEVRSLVKFGRSIGAGTFGHCNLARYRGMVVVVKEYVNDKMTPSQLKDEVLHEAHVIAELGDHPNLPLLYGVSTSSLPYKMVLQYHGINQESLTILKAVKSLNITKEQWATIIKETATGLNHVHTKGFLHNDLKANNVVIEKSQSRFNAVLIDFGKSIRVTDAKCRKKGRTVEEQLNYSNRYPHIAPEIVDGSGAPSVKSDVFSFGKLVEYIEKHTPMTMNELDCSGACKAAILKNPKMRPNLDQIVAIKNN